MSESKYYGEELARFQASVGSLEKAPGFRSAESEESELKMEEII